MTEGSWTCHACTFDNVVLDLRCLICGNRQPRSCTVGTDAVSRETKYIPECPAACSSDSDVNDDTPDGIDIVSSDSGSDEDYDSSDEDEDFDVRQASMTNVEQYFNEMSPLTKSRSQPTTHQDVIVFGIQYLHVIFGNISTCFFTKYALVYFQENVTLASTASTKQNRKTGGPEKLSRAVQKKQEVFL